MALGDRMSITFLKTKSLPTDNYQELFTELGYETSFVPVLEHSFSAEGLTRLRSYISDGQFSLSPDSQGQNRSAYGGLIFTSQRAVEAFAQEVSHWRNSEIPLQQLLPPEIPIYVVGPATGKSIRALGLSCAVFGEESGNGEALAEFILDHYNRHVADLAPNLTYVKPGLLFVVGETRRDIIPRTLQSEALSPDKRIAVEELTVYETTVKQSFASDFQSTIQSKREDCAVQWVVVFSPTGCKVMLEELGILDHQTGIANASVRAQERRILIATIGPTTRDYLVREFEFEPDVCSSSPSPEALSASIAKFRSQLRNLVGN